MVPLHTSVWRLMFLDISDVGGGSVQVGAEEVELQGLFLNLVGLGGISFGVGGWDLGLEEVLDLLHGLPWLAALLGGVVGERHVEDWVVFKKNWLIV
eukprot:c45410_g1_i1 orf=178-468(+)